MEEAACGFLKKRSFTTDVFHARCRHKLAGCGGGDQAAKHRARVTHTPRRTTSDLRVFHSARVLLRLFASFLHTLSTRPTCHTCFLLLVTLFSLNTSLILPCIHGTLVRNASTASAFNSDHGRSTAFILPSNSVIWQ